MSNARLRKCPTCFRPLSEQDRVDMGLRNGEVLNELCPGRNGPSDIDHIVHNGHRAVQRIFILEYKRDEKNTEGQRRLLSSLRGYWRGAENRQLAIDYKILPLHIPLPRNVLGEVVRWVWPDERQAL